MFIIYKGKCIIYKQKAKQIEEIRICLPFLLSSKKKKVDAEPERRFRVKINTSDSHLK